MKDSRTILKQMLSGGISHHQAAAELRKQAKPFPTLIKWSDNSYSLWPDKGRLTEEEVKDKLGTDSLDDVVKIAFK
ncbi:hypothetical protein [Pontibacter arcticus]|uniref:Uncharacterized protein n=1 Tax=Pontibacter arcticus TaxID=2080288 RepID=A0A364RC92_9BACT|nr:hypothetical protein [Pontibacter arcticus]RAU81970.1 hypothetical protein DP923_14925 [Pontibacter arcticus]